MCAVPIEQLETHDGAADEPPVASRSMYVGGKDAGDALGIVRWQRGEGQAILGQKFDDIANSRAASYRYLRVR